MNKKGFSLVELLAVIVILAIIALIATPNIVSLISGGKEDTYQIQINNIKAAMKNYVTKNNISFPNSGSVYLTLYQLASDHLVDYKINNPITGKNISLDTVLEIKNTGNGLEYIVNINDADASYTDEQLSNLPTLELYNDYGSNDQNLEELIKVANTQDNDLKDEVTITKIDDTKYMYSLTHNNITVTSFYNITFYIGKEVYFDPIAGRTCNDYNIGSSTSGIKIGCMKWYIYNIDGDYVDMILDHNTTPLVLQSDIEVALKNDVSLWINFVRDNARLITIDEINTILSEEDLFNASWLYDNTYCELEEDKCKYKDENTYNLNSSSSHINGYYTNTLDASNNMVIKPGAIDTSNNETIEYGIRPVIRISSDLVL